MITLLHPRRSPASGMAGDAAAGLPCLRVEAQSNHRFSRRRDIHGIAINHLTPWNGHRFGSIEGDTEKS